MEGEEDSQTGTQITREEVKHAIKFSNNRAKVLTKYQRNIKLFTEEQIDILVKIHNAEEFEHRGSLTEFNEQLLKYSQ